MLISAKTLLAILPIPFFFHFYEYHSHLIGKEAELLYQVFLVSIIIVGIITRKMTLPFFFWRNVAMILISLLLGHLFIADDRSWFQPFGRDVAILFISLIYIIGQLVVRGIIKVAKNL